MLCIVLFAMVLSAGATALRMFYVQRLIRILT